ncbi:hypothetical protein [Kitasatospora phosalacinea]|uniref:Uncharacterized protein n=1 Tax=Kitasatospora phosalacinea TaxID=2065 RepID=A0A9W6PDP4_9ACTN|nr:hypothetical protein [Kitasatospora phosalacinea]GLW53979.1 hypothetical protein Kpho01_19900 [Kitasatospora phosalacinea]
MAAIPQDLLDRIRTLERTVRELTGRSQTRPALDQIQHGQVTIGEGGTLTVKDGDGTAVLHIGDVLPNHPDGSPQYGLLLRREDGSLALSMWTDGIVPQGLDIWDSRGHVIFSEDRNTGGLARPYLQTPLYPSNDLERYTWTDQGSPWAMWSGDHVRHHPKLLTAFYLQADSGTVGRAQIYIDDVPWGSVHETNGGWDYAADGPLLCPGNYMDYVTVEIRAWRVSGSGRVRVCPSSIIGVQS